MLIDNYMQNHLVYKSGLNWEQIDVVPANIAMEFLVQRVEQLEVYSAAFVKGQKIVAAIDFGTCNTKMAFAYKPLTRGEEARVVVMNAWENAPPPAHMAPTTILIDHTGEVTSYGYEAEEKFRTLPAAQAKKTYLFKSFKMALHQKEVRNVLAVHTNKFRLATPLTASQVDVILSYINALPAWMFFLLLCMQSFSEQYKIPAINGGEMPAIKVFSLALKYLAAKLMKFITSKIGLSSIPPRNILWVLTVPAIWKPGARQFMRNAAYKVMDCMHTDIATY